MTCDGFYWMDSDMLSAMKGAMRHPRRWVFVGVVTALFAMTVLSVLMGQAASIIPAHYVTWTAIALFLGFGIKLIYDAICMEGGCGMGNEQAAALDAVQGQTSMKSVVESGRAIVLKAFTLTFVAEWGDRTQFATVTLATTHHPLGITLGATLGHAICAAIAILCGTFIAGKISERWLTGIGGSLFILFGLITALATV